MKKVYIILSNQPFDLPNKTNKHYVAEELASRGEFVVFVDPPTRFKFIKSLIKKRKFELVKKQAPNFYVYYPVNLLNFYPFSNFSNWIHSKFIKRIVKKFGSRLDEFGVILWVYHFDFPRIFQFKRLINPSVFIYDCVDSYEDFPEYSWEDITNKGLVKYVQMFDRFFKIKIDQKGKSGKGWVRYRERQLAKESNIIYTSHPSLYEKFVKLNKNTYYTPNAGNFSTFSKKPLKIPDVLETLKKPRVLYVGTLDNYKFDVDTFTYLAKNTPHINYALVGMVKLSDSSNKVDKLKDLPNVYLTGPLPKGDIYSHVFDAYIIPYRLNPYTINGCFPIKLYNALSSGVPTVVSDMPCYAGLENLLYIPKSKQEWVKDVKKAVKENNPKIKRLRIEAAKKNTWEHKVDIQQKAIRDYLKSR